MDGPAKDTALLKGIASHFGLTPAAIARRAKVAVTTINRPFSGTSQHRLSQPTIEKLQAAFADYPGWSDYLRGDPEMHAALVVGGRSERHSETLAIPMLELGYGMGGTFLDGIDPGEVIEHFPRSFVRMFTKAPEQLLCFSHGIGDSMYPTIGDRDVLLIDRSRDTISVNDQIWVLSVGGIGMVKRVRMGGGKITLLSDNENVPDYDPGDDELQIIGRVVAVVRRI